MRNFRCPQVIADKVEKFLLFGFKYIFPSSEHHFSNKKNDDCLSLKGDIRLVKNEKSTKWLKRKEAGGVGGNKEKKFKV